MNCISFLSKVLTLIMVGVGFILSMIFHAGTEEPPEVVVNGQSTKSEAMVMVNFYFSDQSKSIIL